MENVIEVESLNKTYAGGFQALVDINLRVQQGEIFALLGPNGAGKTTLISIICGITTLTQGAVKVGGHDIIKDFRAARSLVGLVPQELTGDAFETVWNTVRFSRGLFGKKRNDVYLEQLLKDLALWDKRHNKLMTLSGGMKRRVLIAKALSHEPRILFLDEPTAGVDVELRKSMWQQVHQLRQSGVTIILTTHYIEEAEEMADRIGVISAGRLILTEEKQKLMKKLGYKQLSFELSQGLDAIPEQIARENLELTADGQRLVYTYETAREENGIAQLLADLEAAQIRFRDLQTHQSSLEEIFVGLVKNS